jgi:Concanavalin A-like lectin/glucanases superfamily
MSVFGSVALVVAAVILGYIIYRLVYGNKASYGPPDATVLVSGSLAGTTRQESEGDMPRSYNQQQGIAFTYACWILVNDFTMNYGKKRAIFTKDDCPGVYLDTTSNGILVAIDTYGSKETILIDNIPAAKWIHFALVVDQDAVDIYVDGVLKQHHSLAQLPKQNKSSVKMGSSWDGVLAQLYYYPRCLSATDIQTLSSTVPTDDLKKKPAGPPYFDMTWYTGRLTSH